MLNILEKLKQTKGLANFYILTEADKAKIRKLEFGELDTSDPEAPRAFTKGEGEPRNIGVLECLKRGVVIAMTHDSSFREPTEPITKEVNKKIIFPKVPFPEIKGAISSSPGWKVHEFLKTKISIKEGEATLIVGFDK